MSTNRKPGRPPKDQPIVVQTRREKTRMEPQLSERRVIKDTKYKKEQESVHFNMGFMPGNSFRCKKCRAGFAIPQGDPLVCVTCGSKELVPHSTDFIA